jgi:aspartyl-tRNA(Asn)/glutamyl-tRNA(Gln) amidotransferase subunit B
MSEVLRKLKETGGSASALPFGGETLGDLIRLVDEGKVSGTIAKDVFEKMFASGEAPGAIIEREGLSQVSDPGAIAEIARRILEAHPDQVAEYRGGKDKVLGFFVGQVMKASKGKANPAIARDTLLKLMSDEGQAFDS